MIYTIACSILLSFLPNQENVQRERSKEEKARLQLIQRDGFADMFIARLSYWRLIESLSRDKGLSQQLGIDIRQQQQINRVISDDAIHETHDEIVDKQSKNGTYISDEHVWLELDDIIKEELQGAIDERQLLLLKQRRLRSISGTPIGIVRNEEALRFLRVTTTKELISTWEREEDLYRTQLYQLRRDCMAGFAASLGTEALSRLKRYCSGLEESSGALEPNADFEMLPYSDNCRTEMLQVAAYQPFFQKKLNITSVQIAKIAEINRAITKGLLENPALKGSNAIETQLSKNRRLAISEIRKLFDQKQYEAILMEAAFIELTSDFRKQVGRKEFVDYLVADAQERSELHEVAERQARRMTEGIERLREMSFHRIALTLPNDARKKLFDLFEGSWILKSR